MKLFLAMTVTALVLLTNPVNSHDWYPEECCNDNDCAEATVVKKTKRGIYLKHGKFNTTHFIPWKGSEFRPSPDNKWHICVNDDVGSEARGTILCIFGPVGI